jgi:hypothetical protein
MGLCPDQCADFNMVDIKAASCKLVYRKMNIKAIGFYKCNVVLPSPLTCENLEPLMTGDNKALVFSNELVNVSVGEPQIEARKLSDCRAEQEEIVEREITFQDKIKVDVNSVGDATPFNDYLFWKDKKDHATQLNFCFVMCDGSLIVPRETNSLNGMSASFNVFLNYEALSKGGAIEFKQGKLKFLGDPLDFIVPELNLSNCETLAGLW